MLETQNKTKTVDACISTANTIYIETSFLKEIGAISVDCADEFFDYTKPIHLFLKVVKDKNVKTLIEERPLYELNFIFSDQFPDFLRHEFEQWCHLKAYPSSYDTSKRNFPKTYRFSFSSFEYSSYSRVEFELAVRDLNFLQNLKGFAPSKGHCFSFVETEKSLRGIMTKGRKSKDNLELPFNLEDSLDVNEVKINIVTEKENKSEFEPSSALDAVLSTVSHLTGLEEVELILPSDFRYMQEPLYGNSKHSPQALKEKNEISLVEKIESRVGDYLALIVEQEAGNFGFTVEEGVDILDSTKEKWALEEFEELFNKTGEETKQESPVFLNFLLNYKNLTTNSKFQISLNTSLHKNGVLNEEGLLDAALRLKNEVADYTKWTLVSSLLKEEF